MIQNITTFFTQSSEDPTKLSAVLTGILISLASFLSQYATMIPIIHNFFASPAALNVDLLAQSLGMIGGGIWAIFGLLRKASNKVDSVVVK